ncbi:hypothetical protein, partial [Staphylococcus aureus]
SQSGQDVVLSESFVEIPLQFLPSVSSNTGYYSGGGISGASTAFSSLSYKQSSILTINNLLVQTAGGQILVSEATSATAMINFCRTLLDIDYDFSRE